MVPTKTTKSSISRLMGLPEVFTVNMLMSMEDMTQNEAGVYAFRWKSEGYISSLGDRTGIFFNKLVNKNAESDNKMAALYLLYPSLVKIGSSVLHDAGWTTQIPSSLQIAVKQRRSYPSIAQVEVHGRKDDWYRTFFKYMQQEGGVYSLAPAAALADICMAQKDGLWLPDADDLDIGEDEWAEIERVFSVLDVPLPEQYSQYFDEAFQEDISFEP